MTNFERAKALHKRVGMVDAHMDLASELFNRHKMGQGDVIKNLYLETWKKAGLKLVISSIFVENEHLPEQGLSMALRQVNLLKKEIVSLADELILVVDQASLDQVLNTDKIGILLSFEGLSPIMNSCDLLDSFYDLGVRGAGLVWSRRNYVAEGSYFGDGEKGIRGGLSPFGIEVIDYLTQKNMFIDISHLNDEGVEDVFKFTKTPILASHSNCRAINGIRRNLTDNQLLKIAQSGGVIGVNNIRPIVTRSDDDYITAMCNHIDHMVRIAGIDAVGFGFDLCKGIEETGIRYGNQPTEIVDVLESHEDAVLLTEKLLSWGYDEKSCEKILSGNMLAFIRKFLA